jgi:hypothetical protein
MAGSGAGGGHACGCVIWKLVPVSRERDRKMGSEMCAGAQGHQRLSSRGMSWLACDLERLHLAATWRMNGWMQNRKGTLGQEAVLGRGQGQH